MTDLPNLDELRPHIDRIDADLYALLAERFRVTHQVGVYKAAHNIPPIDPAREEVQFARVARLATENGLDPDFAKKVLRLIIDEVVKNHEILAQKQG